MGFWGNLAKALKIGAKAAEVAEPIIAMKNPELAKEVGTVAGVVDAVIPQPEEKEQSK